VPRFLTRFGARCWNLELQNPMVSVFIGFSLHLEFRSLHESMDSQKNLGHLMELRENDVGQELKSGSYNLHDSSIINCWTLVVCLYSPLRCTIAIKNLKT